MAHENWHDKDSSRALTLESIKSYHHHCDYTTLVAVEVWASLDLSNFDLPIVKCIMCSQEK